MATKKYLDVGDLIWAKMKHFPFWPAKIASSPTVEEKVLYTVKGKKKSFISKKAQHYVFFFGTYNCAWITDENIVLHSSEMLTKISKIKSTSYLKAIDEIIEASASIPGVKTGKKDYVENDKSIRNSTSLRIPEKITERPSITDDGLLKKPRTRFTKRSRTPNQKIKREKIKKSLQKENLTEETFNKALCIVPKLSVLSDKDSALISNAPANTNNHVAVIQPLDDQSMCVAEQENIKKSSQKRTLTEEESNKDKSPERKLPKKSNNDSALIPFAPTNNTYNEVTVIQLLDDKDESPERKLPKKSNNDSALIPYAPTNNTYNEVTVIQLLDDKDKSPERKLPKKSNNDSAWIPYAPTNNTYNEVTVIQPLDDKDKSPERKLPKKSNNDSAWIPYAPTNNTYNEVTVIQPLDDKDESPERKLPKKSNNDSAWIPYAPTNNTYNEVTVIQPLDDKDISPERKLPKKSNNDSALIPYAPTNNTYNEVTVIQPLDVKDKSPERKLPKKSNNDSAWIPYAPTNNTFNEVTVIQPLDDKDKSPERKLPKKSNNDSAWIPYAPTNNTYNEVTVIQPLDDKDKSPERKLPKKSNNDSAWIPYAPTNNTYNEVTVIQPLDDKDKSPERKLPKKSNNDSAWIPYAPTNNTYNEVTVIQPLDDQSMVAQEVFEVPPGPSSDLSRPSTSTTVNDRNIKPTSKKIGFIGLGTMGQRIVEHLLNSRHDVSVWNRTPEKCKHVVEAGARKFLTPAELVRHCDIIFCCVSGPRASKSVIYQEDGILQGLEKCEPGTKSYIEMTTMYPETSANICQAVTQKGGRYLEAPMVGSSYSAENGTLIIHGAGDEEVFHSCSTVFSAICLRTFFISPEIGRALNLNIIFRTIWNMSYTPLLNGMRMMRQLGLGAFIPDFQTDFASILRFICP